MNMKIMPKLAIGGLCLAAASLGSIGCTNSGSAKNVDNVLDADTVELSTQKPVEKPIDYNYKLKSRLNETSENMEQYTRSYGTNGSSIYLQFLHDIQDKKMPSASNLIGQIKSVIDSNPENRYSEEEKAAQVDVLNQLEEIARSAEKEYHEVYSKELKENLFNEGAPDTKKCDDFLNEQFDALYEDLSDDEYNEKVTEHERDLNAFKKQLGNLDVQKHAELMAYRQYKLDSIAHGIIFEGVLGDFMTPEVFKFYQRKHSEYKGKPTP